MHPTQTGKEDNEQARERAVDDETSNPEEEQDRQARAARPSGLSRKGNVENFERRVTEFLKIRAHGMEDHGCPALEEREMINKN